MTVLEKLQVIFQKVVNRQDITITPASSPQDIKEWDSLTQIKLILSIEEEFGLKFSTMDIMNINCVRDFIEIIQKKS